MGSFPFLNNSIIAEGGKPPEIPDPMVSMQNALKVQQLRQQNATFPITQAHLQAETNELNANTQRVGLANTATQRDMDEEKQTQAELAAAGPDPENIKARALKMTNPKIQATLLKTAGDLETRNATMTAKKHDEYGKQLLGIANNLEAIKKATGPTQLGLWAQEVQDAYALKDEDGKPLIAPGTLDPTTVPPPETLQALQDHVDKFGAFHLQQAKLKDESEKAAKAEQDRVKVAGENLKELHNEAYAALQGADTKESWTRAVSDFAAVDKAHADYAKRFLNVLPYGDGKRALAIVKNRSIPADKQVSEDTADKRAAAAGGISGLIQRANDPSLAKGSPEWAAAQKDVADYERVHMSISAAANDRFDKREADRARKEASDDASKHDDLQRKEQDAWATNKNYDAAVTTALKANPKAETVKDPKNQNRDIPIEQAENESADARSKALSFQDQAKGLRKKNSWGEYGANAHIQIPDGKGGWKDATVPSANLKAALSRGARLPK